MSASQQDTGKEGQPPEPQPRELSPPASRPPLHSYILLTFHPPRRARPVDAPLADTDSLPASEPPTASQPETASSPPGVSPPPAVSPPPGVSDAPPRSDASRQVAQRQISGNARIGMYATRLLDASMIVIGAALFLSALATLTGTWAWSWHASSGATFTLSGVHGICTSAMGELAQGASSAAATSCLWVDLTWTEAIGLTGGGCILAAIGVARIVRALRPPA